MKARVILLASILLVIPRLTAAAAFDSLAVGARANGMGGAFTAVADDPSAIYWNPAGLMNLHRPELLVSHFDVESLGLLSYDYLAFAMPFVLKNAVGLSWTRLGTSANMTFLNYTENTFTLTFQQPLAPEASLAVNLKVLSVLYEKSAGGVGFDVGGRFQLLPELAAAFMVENFNQPEITWMTDSHNVDKLPYNLRVGIAAYPMSDITLALDVDHITDSKRQTHLGTELWFFGRVLALRAGMQYMQDGGHLMPAAGLGVRISFLELAYAYTGHYDFDGNHVFSLQWGF